MAISHLKNSILSMQKTVKDFKNEYKKDREYNKKSISDIQKSMEREHKTNAGIKKKIIKNLTINKNSFRTFRKIHNEYIKKENSLARRIIRTVNFALKKVKDGVYRTLGRAKDLSDIDFPTLIGASLAKNMPIVGYFISRAIEKGLFPNFVASAKRLIHRGWTGILRFYRKYIRRFISPLTRPIKSIFQKISSLWKRNKKNYNVPTIKNATPPKRIIENNISEIENKKTAINNISSKEKLQAEIEIAKKIPHLQSGGYITSGGIAQLHPAEVVVPLEENTGLIDKLSNKISKVLTNTLKTILASTTIVLPLGKAFKAGFKEIYTEFRHGENLSLQERAARAVFDIRNSIVGKQGLIGMFSTFRNAVLFRLPVLSVILKLTTGFLKSKLIPFKLLFKRFNTYKSDLPTRGSTEEKTANILGIIYVGMMSKFDQVNLHLANISKATAGFAETVKPKGFRVITSIGDFIGSTLLKKTSIGEKYKKFKEKREEKRFDVSYSKFAMNKMKKEQENKANKFPVKFAIEKLKSGVVDEYHKQKYFYKKINRIIELIKDIKEIIKKWLLPKMPLKKESVASIRKSNVIRGVFEKENVSYTEVGVTGTYGGGYWPKYINPKMKKSEAKKRKTKSNVIYLNEKEKHEIKPKEGKKTGNVIYLSEIKKTEEKPKKKTIKSALGTKIKHEINEKIDKALKEGFFQRTLNFFKNSKKSEKKKVTFLSNIKNKVAFLKEKTSGFFKKGIKKTSSFILKIAAFIIPFLRRGLSLAKIFLFGSLKTFLPIAIRMFLSPVILGPVLAAIGGILVGKTIDKYIFKPIREKFFKKTIEENKKISKELDKLTISKVKKYRESVKNVNEKNKVGIIRKGREIRLAALPSFSKEGVQKKLRPKLGYAGGPQDVEKFRLKLVKQFLKHKNFYTAYPDYALKEAWNKFDFHIPFLTPPQKIPILYEKDFREFIKQNYVPSYQKGAIAEDVLKQLSKKEKIKNKIFSVGSKLKKPIEKTISIIKKPFSPEGSSFVKTLANKVGTEKFKTLFSPEYLKVAMPKVKKQIYEIKESINKYEKEINELKEKNLPKKFVKAKEEKIVSLMHTKILTLEKTIREENKKFKNLRKRLAEKYGKKEEGIIEKIKKPFEKPIQIAKAGIYAAKQTGKTLGNIYDKISFLDYQHDLHALYRKYRKFKESKEKELKENVEKLKNVSPKEIGKKIEKGKNYIGDAGKKVIGRIKNESAKATTIGKNLVGKSKKIIDSTIKENDNLIKNAIGKSEKYIKTAIEKSKNIIGSTVDRNKKYINNIIEKSKNIIGSTVDRNKKHINNIIEKSKNIIGSTVDRNKKYIGSTVDRNKKYIGNAIKKSEKYISNAIEKSKNIIGPTVDKKYIEKNINRRNKGLIDYIGDGIKHIWSSIDYIGDGIKHIWSSIEKGKNVIGKIIHGDKIIRETKEIGKNIYKKTFIYPIEISKIIEKNGEITEKLLHNLEMAKANAKEILNHKNEIEKKKMEKTEQYLKELSTNTEKLQKFIAETNAIIHKNIVNNLSTINKSISNINNNNSGGAHVADPEFNHMLTKSID